MRRLPANIDRDREIVDLYMTGRYSMQELADMKSISKARVGQIIQKYAGADVSEDIASDEHAVRLRIVMSKMMEIVTSPPSYKISATGKLVEHPDGGYVTDWSDQMTAANILIKADESERKLKGRDRPRQRELDRDEAMARVQEYLANLERLREKLPPIEAEVIREIESD